MKIQVSSYTPEWHNRLLEYMKSVYPHRDVKYLEWWISNIDYSDAECWEKCTIIMDDTRIIGCTTVNDARILIDSVESRFFSRGNTIVSANLRGKGLSKEIYKRVNLYDNWFSVGVTDIAWKIQPKYVRNFTPIIPVRVYISFSLKGLFSYMMRKLFSHKKDLNSLFPTNFNLNKREKFEKVDDVGSLNIPKDGRWTSDAIELVRDKSFFKKRYEDLYCHDRYHIYQYLLDENTEGYIVLRSTFYKGLDMISLVDFRFRNRDDETKALKAAVKVAGMCGIALVITLTSRMWGNILSPLTIKTKKKLHSAVGMKEIADKFSVMLITSADSDLDFVYYI